MTRPVSRPAARPPARLAPARIIPPPPEPQVPHINYVFPAGGQQGTTVRATVGGLFLDGPRSLRVSGDGLKADVTDTVDGNTFHVSVTIAPDAAVGPRDLRVVTRGGVSNRFRFTVGDLPEVTETEPNSKADQAQGLKSLPVLVNGQIMPGDKDLFRFAARKGAHLVYRVQSRDILPYIADAVPGWAQLALTLRDAQGAELAYCDDWRFQPDPVLIFDVPKDGDYLLELKDTLYRGREDFVYRLAIGAVPFLTDLYPLGGRRGAATEVALSGVNLSRPSLSVKPPADGPNPIPVAPDGPLASNARPFWTDDLTEQNETEPNDTQQQANAVDVPVVINGRIDRAGDFDWYRFKAAAAQHLVVEVCARRLGSPLDSAIALLDAKGLKVADNDDTADELTALQTHSADSKIAWKIAAAGDYYVRIGDAQGRGGPEYAYRLTISPPRPDFALLVLPDNPRLGPGDTAVLTARAIRQDRFDGEIRLTLTGLPPGYAVRGAVIPPKETEVRFTITEKGVGSPLPVGPTGASHKGLPTPFSLGMTAEGTIAGRPVVRRAAPAEAVMQAFAYIHRVPTQELLLAVVDFVPFVLSTDLAPDQILDVPQGGQAKLIVKVTRKNAKSGTITLAADQPPRNITARGTPVPQDKTESEVTITAQRQAPVGYVQNLILAGTLRIGKDTIVRVAPAIPIRIVPAPPASAPATQMRPGRIDSR